MSSQHTDSSLFVQPSDDDLWAQEMVPRLPDDLEAQARRLGAFQRVRGIRCASDVLRALLSYVLDQHSLCSLGAWAVLIGIGCLSERAWGKRLRRSTAWLLWLFNALLPTPTVASRPLPQPLKRILLIDATRLRSPAAPAMDTYAQGSYAECSQWVMSKLCVTTLCQQVRGQWSSRRVQACLPLLTRYLYRRRRQRRRQDHEVQAWLESRLEHSSQEQQRAA